MSDDKETCPYCGGSVVKKETEHIYKCLGCYRRFNPPKEKEKNETEPTS